MLRAAAALAAVLASLGVAAHVPARCSDETAEVEREALNRAEVMGKVGAADPNDIDEVLARIAELLQTDRTFADALNRWIMCVAEVE